MAVRPPAPCLATCAHARYADPASFCCHWIPWVDTADGKALLSHNGQRQLGEGEVLAIAAFAGAMSALVSSPAELVMIQQQKSGSAVRRGLGVARSQALSRSAHVRTVPPPWL